VTLKRVIPFNPLGIVMADALVAVEWYRVTLGVENAKAGYSTIRQR